MAEYLATETMRYDTPMAAELLSIVMGNQFGDLERCALSSG
jgi:hypothetical protein